LLLVFLGLALLGLFVFAITQKRYSHEDPTKYAWYLEMPGMVDDSKLENIYSMKELAEQFDLSVDQEYGVAQQMLAEGSYSQYGYDRLPKMMPDGHWALYRPASSGSKFSWHTYYRVSPFFTENNKVPNE